MIRKLFNQPHVLKLWSLQRGYGELEPLAMRTRDDVRLWAAGRFIPAGEYQAALPGPWSGRAKRLWEAVLKRHPSFRIVRVEVKLLKKLAEGKA